MRNNRLTILCLSLFLGFSFPAMAQKRSKEDKLKAYIEARSLIDGKLYQFTGRWAYPQKGGQVDLMTRPNFLKIENDLVSADMPYFGEVTGGNAGYGGSGGGITFNSEKKDYTVKYNDKKENITISFKVMDGMESYNCIFILSSVSSVSLSISGTSRQIIRYMGEISGIEKN